MKNRKCGFCKNPSEKLAKCNIFKVEMRTYGSNEWYRRKFPDVDTRPEYQEPVVMGTSIIFLCDNCKRKEYIRCGLKFKPTILYEIYCD